MCQRNYELLFIINSFFCSTLSDGIHLISSFGLYVGEDQVFAKLTLVPAVIIRDFMRSLISPAILLPRPAAFNSTHVFIRIAGFGTYTVDNMDALLAMSQSEHLWPIYERYEITPKGRENIPVSDGKMA